MHESDVKSYAGIMLRSKCLEPRQMHALNLTMESEISNYQRWEKSKYWTPSSPITATRAKIKQIYPRLAHSFSPPSILSKEFQYHWVSIFVLVHHHSCPRVTQEHRIGMPFPTLRYFVERYDKTAIIQTTRNLNWKNRIRRIKGRH